MNRFEQESHYKPREDFIRVATATPEVSVGDVSINVDRITSLYQEAADGQASLVVFPELSLTGYTIQDLVQRQDLLQDARHNLAELAARTKGVNTAMIVGLPLAVGNAIYNAAALLADGDIKGIIPKQNLPTYNEFYEKRWYQAWDDRPNTTIDIEGEEVPFGRDHTFSVGGATVGIEICEDLWMPFAPHEKLAANGALIVANPSASPETTTKTTYRRNLVGISAAKNALGYIYVSSDHSESTAEIVMSGHAMISENGTLLQERAPLDSSQDRLTIADIDTWHLQHDRQRNTNFPNNVDITPINTTVSRTQTDLERFVNPLPFIPNGTEQEIHERLDGILNIQALALARRLQTMPNKQLVLGLSGGLDSTLALLVAVRTAGYLKKQPGELIHTLTMPSTASSERTQSNAIRLSESLGIPNEEIAIAELSAAQLQALDHSGDEDTTFENTQARIRQALVFNKANQLGGLALGTGDLSEAALGWCTYGGDQTSGYHVNSSIPKTLVRSLVHDASHHLPDQAREIIADILDTPVSPELTGDGTAISQHTEDIIGPYELHDFFLYHFVRWAEPKRKIGFLALKAFEGAYDEVTIANWLDVFTSRFYNNQWKRQAMPDGPKVGLSLGPRGDWRMPPDIKEPLKNSLQSSGII